MISAILMLREHIRNLAQLQQETIGLKPWSVAYPPPPQKPRQSFNGMAVKVHIREKEKGYFFFFCVVAQKFDGSRV